MKSHKRMKLAALVLSGAVLLSGCQVGNTNIVLLKPIHFNQVFKIDDEVCGKKEAKVYLTNYMNIYGNAYGIHLWKQDIETEELAQYVKDVTVSQLSKVKCMNGIAREQDIELTEEEEKKVKEAAEAYYESLSKEERKYMGVRKSNIEDMYEEYWIAMKVYQSLMKGVDEEVSDDEARVIEAMQIFVTDKSRAKEVRKRLKNGEDFAAVAGAYNEKGKIELSFGREDMPEEVVKEAFELENEEISGTIETKDGYYFIKCVNKYNQELTDQNKKVILERRKQEAFHNVYDEYVANISTVFNEKMWKKVSVEPEETVETDSFFEVIDKAMEDK